MNEWENIKFVDSSLKEWATSYMSTQGYGRERMFVADFFGTQPYLVVSETVGSYHHNIAQYVQERFFKSKGFEKVLESCPDSGYSGYHEAPATAAEFEDIEYDLGKAFRGYSKAAIGYTKGEDRVLVMVERSDSNEIEYRIFSSPEHSGLKKEWFDLAAKDNMYRGKKINAACKFLDLKDISWDDVILPEGVKTLLKNMVTNAFSKRHIYLKNGLSLKRGVMFAGGPGNGKTTALKVIIWESEGVTGIYAQPAHLMTAKDVRAVCQMARDLSPSLLVLEDLDWIAEDRNTGDAGRVIELMNQMDGLEDFTDVITVASTNDLEKIEGAIKNRPGRFDRVIKIDNPDEDSRLKMLQLFCKKWIVEEIDIVKVVKFSDKLSGAHMADLCKTAAGIAIESGSLTEDNIVVLKPEHFEAAINEVKNKDYSAYLQCKSGGKKKPMGFNGMDDDDD